MTLILLYALFWLIEASHWYVIGSRLRWITMNLAEALEASKEELPQQ